jgi:hypothetical protein
MNITFEQLKDLIELAIIIIAFIALYKSVPADKVAELRQKAGDLAGKTGTPADDILLQIYDYIQAVSGAKKATSGEVSYGEAQAEEKPRD